MKKNKHVGNDLGMLQNLSIEFAGPPIIPSVMLQKIKNRDEIPDIEFDDIYPPRMRAISDVQWSSLAVAYQIASMLGKTGNARFIDIGSGVGKLCTLLSLLTDLKIFGIEQRIDLYEISCAIAKTNQLDQVHFIHGNMLELNWSNFDIFYLYNPFQEHAFEGWNSGVIDRNIELDRKIYAQYVDEVLHRMTALEPGKKVITFHGYGGKMPSSMKLLDDRSVDNGHLLMWEKQLSEET